MSSLSACSLTALAAKSVDALTGQPETQQSAQMHNRALENEVDALLAFISDGDWEAPLGDNLRTECDVKEFTLDYFFYGSWYSPGLADAPADREAATSAVDELRAWLQGRGWTDLEPIDFSTAVVGVNAIGIAGTHLESGVSGMQAIFYYEGDIDIASPHVVVDIDSDCLPTDL